MIGYSKSVQLNKSVKKKSQTELNIEANKSLDDIYKEKGLYTICEAQVSKNCLPKESESFGQKLSMTYAHRHKRRWYKESNKKNLLGTFNQTIRACVACHVEMEARPELTERLFKVLRGSEES